MMNETNMLENAKNEIDASIDSSTPIYTSLTYNMSNEDRKAFVEYAILKSFGNFNGIRRNIIINQYYLKAFIDINSDLKVISDGKVLFAIDGEILEMFIGWSRDDSPRKCLRFEVV